MSGVVIVPRSSSSVQTVQFPFRHSLVYSTYVPICYLRYHPRSDPEWKQLCNNFTMMKSAIVSLLLASASAFAPASQVSKTYCRFTCVSWSDLLFVDCYAWITLLTSCSMIKFNLLVTVGSKSWVCILECRGNVQVHPLFGSSRKARWFDGRRYGFWPHASVSTLFLVHRFFHSKQIESLFQSSNLSKSDFPVLTFRQTWTMLAGQKSSMVVFVCLRLLAWLFNKQASTFPVINSPTLTFSVLSSLSDLPETSKCCLASVLLRELTSTSIMVRAHQATSVGVVMFCTSSAQSSKRSAKNRKLSTDALPWLLSLAPLSKPFYSTSLFCKACMQFCCNNIFVGYPDETKRIRNVI